MNEFLMGFIGAGAALVLPRVAGRIASVVSSAIRGTSPALLGLDDALETRLGVDLPEWVHAAYHRSVIGAVAFAESAFGTKEFWNKVFFILRGKPDMIAVRLLELMSQVDWSRGLDQVLPLEVKSLVNEAKKDMAKVQVRASLATLPPAVQPTDAHIERTIEAVAPVAGRTVVPARPAGDEVETPDLQARIAETKRKLLEHMASLEAKP